MGRHSAQGDDATDVEPDGAGDATVAAAADLAGDAAADEAATTGRHARIGAPRPAPERPVEQTRVIPQQELERTARADARERRLRGPRPAELLPVLPGEAIVPPVTDEPDDGVGLLDAVLDGEDRGDAPEETPADAVPGEPAALEPTAVERKADESTVDEPTVGEPSADEPEVVEPGTPVPEVASRRRPLHDGAAATAADLALLRHDRTLLARTLAAVVTPFVLYVIVLLVGGASGRTYAVWIWIPIVIASVLAGAMLDIAHKKAGESPPEDSTPDETAQDETAPGETVQDDDVSGS